MMTPEIVDRDEFIVVGVRSVFEAGVEGAASLWERQFLPRRNEVESSDHTYYGVFNPLPNDTKGTRYEYVAGVAAGLENIPVGMVGWVIPAGKYAEADATGLSGIGHMCRHIITDWLPDSDFNLVASPMFAYTSHSHPDSPDAVWRVAVPIETPEVLEEMKKWLI